jgi:hypothetical protein
LLFRERINEILTDLWDRLLRKDAVFEESLQAKRGDVAMFQWNETEGSMRNQWIRLPLVPIVFAIIVTCVFSPRSLAQGNPTDANATTSNGSPNEQPDNSTPPQSMIDTVRQGVEGMCHANKDCIVQYVASEQFRRFQFLVGHGASDNTDFGWLTEFKIPENGHTCEDEGNCLVVFVTPWAGKDGVESAKQLKKGWWIALQYRGTLQSLSSAGVGTKLNLGYSANALTVNGHTWQFDNGSGFYVDSVAPATGTVSSTGSIIVEFSKKTADGYFAVVHPDGAQEGLGFILYCKKVVNSELWATDANKLPWVPFKANQPVDPSCKPLKQGKRYRISPLPVVSPEIKVYSYTDFADSDDSEDFGLQLFDAKIIETLKVSESSSEAGTAVNYFVLDEGDLTEKLLDFEQDTLKQQAQAKEEAQAKAAFRAAPLTDQNTKPITVVVEKTYLNTNIASGSPLGLWAEVRISSEDAKRLHDPVGVPKNLAWHLVPELADGRLRFAIICNPNRKDCFKLSPGKTYALELMNQYDSKGARGNLDMRFVRVNGVGVYMVADYSGADN